MANRNFEIDTKGMCLMCFTDCPSLAHQSEPYNLSRSHSFMMLLKYLDINILQLSNFSSSLLESMNCLENIQLVVTLCSKCASITGDFCRKYESCEKIRQNMNTNVQDIYKQMRAANDNPSLVIEYEKRMASCKSPFDVLNASITENLRKETLQKCSLLKLGTGQKLSVAGGQTPIASSDLPPEPMPFQFRRPVQVIPLRENANSTYQITDSRYGQPEGSLNGWVERNDDMVAAPQVDRESTPTVEFVEGDYSVKMENAASILEIVIDDDEDAMVNGQNASPVDNPFSPSTNDSEAAVTRPVTRQSSSTNGVFICPHCDKEFSSHRSRAIHESHHFRVHRSTRQKTHNDTFQCNQCDYTCKTKGALYMHSKNHGVQVGTNRSFECQYCPSRFTQSSSRNTHCLTFHSLKVLAGNLPKGTTEEQLEAAVKREMDKRKITRGQKLNHGCPFCSKMHSCGSLVRIHILKDHCDELVF